MQFPPRSPLFCILVALPFLFCATVSAQTPSTKPPIATKAKKPTKPPKFQPVCLTEEGVLVVSTSGKCTGTTVRADLESLELEAIEGEEGPPGEDGSDGEDGEDGKDGIDGDDGEDGEDGADGSLRIYGDGSEGDFIATSGALFEETNAQFEDIVVPAGVTLSVPSGTIMRCNGTFRNDGAIVVNTFADGAARTAPSASTISVASKSAEAGSSHGPAGSGEFGTGANVVLAGVPARALAEGEAEQLLKPGTRGGGGGGAGLGDGGAGGGTLTVLCRGSITNNGSIKADGGSTNAGGGGGAGGIIILASLERIALTIGSLISVSGAPGGSATLSSGPGGGGSGGLVHLVSPSIENGGSVISGGGTAGEIEGIRVTSTRRSGGGAGGSLAGSGGAGGSVRQNDNPPNEAEDGDDGSLFETLADPTSLL